MKPWLHGEMSGVRAPLGAAGDLSEQALFLSLRIHIIDIEGLWIKSY